MPKSLSGVTHLGLDVSKDSIAVAILRPDERVPDVEKIFHDEESVRRLIGRLGNPARLFACYEAGPTGYELYRLLSSLGVHTDVVAPSLVPRSPGDKVKTDKRDSRRLARLHRAGELTAIRVPTAAEEGVRDLCRARHAAIKDLARARQRLASFLLRHSVVWRDGRQWTLRHRRWVATLSFEDPSLQSAFAFYFGEVTAREATLDAVEAEIAPHFCDGLFAERVIRLSAYRGIDRMGALHLATEVCDFRRFDSAGSFMGFCGLIPREYSRRGVDLAGPHHPGRQRARAQPAGRIGLGLPLRGAGLRDPPSAPRRRRACDRRPVVGRSAAPVPTLAQPGRPQGEEVHRGRRRRPRARGVHVGGDDGMT